MTGCFQDSKCSSQPLLFQVHCQSGDLQSISTAVADVESADVVADAGTSGEKHGGCEWNRAPISVQRLPSRPELVLV